MSTLARAWIVGLMVLMVAAPAGAAIVSIETSAPVADSSDESIKAALREAVEASVESAMAMGIGGVWLDRAVLMEDRVVVRLLALIGEAPDEDRSAVEEEGISLQFPGPQLQLFQRRPETRPDRLGDLSL